MELLTGAERPTNPWLLAAGVAVAVIIGVWALVGGRSEPPELSLPVAGGSGDPAAASSSTVTTAGDVFVHAAGAVRSPGVYRMPLGSRVADLLDAAGGPARDVDLNRLNLAAPLVDGTRVYVPRVGEEVPPELAPSDGSSADGTSRDPVVDINTATQDELEQLPGIGPTTARAILDERERRGRFRSVEELLEVRGIGPAKLDAIREFVRIG
jgi:competence protein ComEA